MARLRHYYPIAAHPAINALHEAARAFTERCTPSACFASDLAHDERAIANVSHDQPFAWIAYEHGTHRHTIASGLDQHDGIIIAMRTLREITEDLAESGPIALHFWTGTMLAPCATVDALIARCRRASADEAIAVLQVRIAVNRASYREAGPTEIYHRQRLANELADLERRIEAINQGATS